jgi:iron complex outermembrane recepter protein
MRYLTRSYVASVLAIACSITSTVTVAQVTSFNIPSQPLAESLRAVAGQTNSNILFNAKEVAGFSAKALNAQMTQDEALQELLKGTGLTYQYLGEKTISVGTMAKTGSNGGGVPHQGIRMAQAQTGSAASASGTGGPNEDRATETAAQQDSAKLEEIVVTAQKRAERLLETPVSIGVLTGDSLEQSGARGVVDALAKIGGVAAIERTPGNTQIIIRGLIPGAGESPTGLYIDEIPFASRLGALPDVNVYDLARVEVLRGPQGTLYGVNALSGVVRVLTADPDPSGFEGKARTRLSSTAHGGENHALDVMLNAPIVPGKLALRAVASYADYGGYVDSLASGAADFNDTEAQSYRIKLGWTPTDRLGVKLGYIRSEIENGGQADSLTDALNTVFSDNQGNRPTYDIHSAVVQYDGNSFAALSSTSYLDYHTPSRFEITFGAGTLNYRGFNQLQSFTQELRFASNGDGPWKWSGGGFYNHRDTQTIQDLRETLGAVFPGVLDVRLETEQYAFFGEVGRGFADGKWELTGGVRYFNETFIDREFGNLTNAPLAANRKGEYDKLTGRGILTFKPQTNRIFYGSVSTGFRGGANQSSSALRQDPTLAAIINPDTIVNYEIGAKGMLFAGALKYDTAVYSSKWEDIQQQLVLPIGFVATVNSGSASGLGVDAGLSLDLENGFGLQAALGWNGLEFDQDTITFTGTPPAPIVLFRKGSRLNTSPEWNASVGGTHRTAVGSDLDLVFSTSYLYRSAVDIRYLRAGILTTGTSGTIETLNSKVGLEGEKWSADIFVENLLDKQSPVTPPNPNAAFMSTYLRPRTIGVQATFNF